MRPIRQYFALALFLFPQTALAQQSWWVQVEARPSLVEAQQRAKIYAEQQDNVAGFYLGTGWYGIALGPYTRADAATLLGRLKSSSAIPSDSFLSRGRNYRTQFWPVGVGASTSPLPLPGTETAEEPALVASPQPEAPAVAAPEQPEQPEEPAPLRDPGETRRQAAASESKLTRAQKEELQIALKAEGFYTSAIDGRYGKGTRAAMSAWQEANRYPATGILSTLQRQELLTAYNTVLEELALQLMQDDASGIRIKLPTAEVDFTRYAPPLVYFEGESAAKVLLVSQAGGSAELAQIYEALKASPLMPQGAQGGLKNGRFTLEGKDAQYHTQADVRLENGAIKGFLLAWPSSDDRRQRRLYKEMQQSFEPLEGTLDPTLVSSAETAPSADIVSGLAIPQSRMARTGFYIDGQGTVLTTAEINDSCDQITTDGGREMKLAHRDDALGLSVLTPEEPISPRATARFQAAPVRPQSQVALAGFPYGGVLPTAAMTFGTLTDLKDLAGDTSAHRLTLTAQASEVGGPLFDNTGSVIGMLLPREDQNGKTLPSEVAFSRSGASLLPALKAAGFAPAEDATVAFQTPEVITDQAAKMTVLVSCWDS